MSSMKGKMITEKQQSMINAITKQLDVHFFGADRHDACAFIGEWIEKLPPKEEMPIIKKHEHGECFHCQGALSETFNFIDIVHQESICDACYSIRQHAPDWVKKTEELKPKAKPRKTKIKPLDEPKKKTELPYTICTSCNNPIFTLEDWVSASPDTCHTCHEKQKKDELISDSTRTYSTCHICDIPVKGVDEFTDIVNRKPLCYKHYIARENDADWIQKDMDVMSLWGSNQHIAQPHNDRPKPKAKPVKSLTKIEPSVITDTFDKLDLLTQPTKPKKRGNNMFNNIKSIMGDFGKITTGDFKLAFQGIAIRTQTSHGKLDGTDAYAVYDADNNRMLDVMDFVLDVDNVLYKMPVALNTLKQGDIILVKDKPLVVKSVNVEAQSVRALNPISNNETTHKPAGNLFGFNFITKVTSMFDMMQPTGEQAGFNPMMLMALNGDKGEGMEGLLPLMMMGGLQGGATANPMQQMLPLMMMSDKSGDSGDMMQMMMMSQMFNGQQGGANPFGAMFGQAPVAPAPVAPTPSGVTDVEAVVDRIIAKLEKRLTPTTDDSSQDTESK